MSLEFREITKDNWEQCIALRPPESQRKLIPTNLYALAESKFLVDRVPLAVYDGDTMVGMVVCSFNPQLHRAWLHRIMIGEEFQGKGTMRRTLRKAIRRFQRLPGCTIIGVDYRPENAELARFFEGFGFRRTGQSTPTGDVVACLRVEQIAPDDESETAEGF